MKYKLTEIKSFKDAKIYTIEGKPNIAVIESTTTYIPIEQFKNAFEELGLLVKSNNIEKLIFDKRSLAVFHQPSMEWYFIEWKEKMFDLGLKIHRKILPNNEVFKHSVKIGRAKIKSIFPDGKYNLMDIAYSESIEDAIEN